MIVAKAAVDHKRSTNKVQQAQPIHLHVSFALAWHDITPYPGQPSVPLYATEATTIIALLHAILA